MVTFLVILQKNKLKAYTDFCLCTPFTLQNGRSTLRRFGNAVNLTQNLKAGKYMMSTIVLHCRRQNFQKKRE